MAFHCPVCGEEFPETTSDLRFQRHVNRCLDGEPDIENPTPVHHAFGATGGDGQHLSLRPNPDSYVSMGGSSLTETPLVSSETGPTNHYNGGHARTSSSPPPQSSGVVNNGSLVGAQPPQQHHLAHAESSSLDYYAAIEENCEFICGLCPDFPRALVEEVLITNGNRKDLAMSTLFELKDQSETAASSSEQGSNFHSYWGGDKSSPHRHHSHLRRSHLQDIGETAVPRDGAYDAVPVPKGPQYSHVELAIYDLQPDSKVAKKVGLGAYHTGVVMYGHEFSFGGSRNLKRDTGRSGIWATRNLYQTAPVIKKRIAIGITYVTIKELQATLREWGKTSWRVDDYHLLSKNCNHFADALLQWLAPKSVPIATTTATDVAPGTPASLSGTNSAHTPLSPVPLAATVVGPVGAAANSNSTRTSSPNISSVPSGVSPLPKFPLIASSSATQSGATAPPPPQVSPTSQAVPTFPLAPEQLKRAQETFKLPSWVNRAAAVGNAVIPDFLFKKIVEALMPPVPEDDHDASPLA
ncbi:Hypothetical protein, putative [Bodo saltans]|uniref:PPPDE domain-containing protein n=1 Tax=Bodo saltans TaxID=75058 RepID=A0A0S4JIX1_BODSA|nr:Hypothetical protein, putative [Bodo saltans]|eukprot:CUG89873.1 Hypothetical protein, putative [Bodo saltans]